MMNYIEFTEQLQHHSKLLTAYEMHARTHPVDALYAYYCMTHTPSISIGGEVLPGHGIFRNEEHDGKVHMYQIQSSYPGQGDIVQAIRASDNPICMDTMPKIEIKVVFRQLDWKEETNAARCDPSWKTSVWPDIIWILEPETCYNQIRTRYWIYEKYRAFPTCSLQGKNFDSIEEAKAWCQTEFERLCGELLRKDE